MPDQYVWLIWSSAFLVPWTVLFCLFPRHRRAMIWASLFTMPFGLTEPLFVPEYWNPPSLLDLAQRTGFDLESLIFCFAIGGVGVALYNGLTGKEIRPVSEAERRRPLHRHHYVALASPFLAFAVLVFFPWNPIYPAMVAMFVGAAATMACRPDLKGKMWVGGGLFLAYYLVFLIGLKVTSPGYIEDVWNLEALSGLAVWGLPIEELLFAFGFGLYWSSVYEHFTWRETASSGPHSSAPPMEAEATAAQGAQSKSMP